MVIIITQETQCKPQKSIDFAIRTGVANEKKFKFLF